MKIGCNPRTLRPFQKARKGVEGSGKEGRKEGLRRENRDSGQDETAYRKKSENIYKKYLKKGAGCGRLNERAEEACEQPE